MKVLVACEESQAVCAAFRELGHEAYSCDIQDCSGDHPEWHIKADALELLKLKWDLIIAHPPCTYLSKAGGEPATGEWRNPTVTIRQGCSCNGVFYGLSQCGLPQNRSRKSCAIEDFWPSSIQSDHPAVHVRRTVDENNLPLAERPASSDGDGYSGANGEMGQLLRSQESEGK